MLHDVGIPNLIHSRVPVHAEPWPSDRALGRCRELDLDRRAFAQASLSGTFTLCAGEAGRPRLRRRLELFRDVGRGLGAETRIQLATAVEEK